MKKQTKVLVAATLLTLGASFSSMAALKNGTWVQNENGWQYADKDGVFVDNKWCLSNGIEYWINEDEVLGSNEWVTDDNGNVYYVQTDGSKTVNAWKFIYAEDDEDADEESWFYFDAKGRMLKSEKKAINGKTYYFDENGKMLTGWVDKTDFTNADEETTVNNVVFCDENGALVKSAWLNEFPWDADLDEMYEGEDEEWYYAKSSGALATKKQSSINGQTYFFDAKTGIMMEGWVIKDADGNYVASQEETFVDQGAVEVYYASEDDGHVKKNGWKELEDPTGDDDYWYYFDKLGRAFLGTATDSNAVNAQYMNFANGEKLDGTAVAKTEDPAFTVEAKKINGVKYYFNANGEMLDGLVTINDKLMYLDGGAAQTGKVTLTDDNENDYTFCFAEKDSTKDGYEKYVAVTGNKEGFCYNNGLLAKAEEEGEYILVNTAAGKFIVNHAGKIQKSTTKDYLNNGKTYTFATKANGVSKNSIVE